MFFEATACYLLSIGTVILACLPVVYVFAEYSPLVAPRMYEFCATFASFYLLNRIMVGSPDVAVAALPSWPLLPLPLLSDAGFIVHMYAVNAAPVSNQVDFPNQILS